MAARYQYPSLVGPVLVPAAAPPYDPAGLEWIGNASVIARTLAARALGDFALPPFIQTPVYDPADLAWQPRSTQPSRTYPPRRLGDFALDPVPRPTVVYDPEPLDWLPRGAQPVRFLSAGVLGHFGSGALFPPLEEVEIEDMGQPSGGRVNKRRRVTSVELARPPHVVHANENLLHMVAMIVTSGALNG